MRMILLQTLVAVLALSAVVVVAGADEVVVLSCAVNFGFESPVPPVFVAGCDKSLGVSPACPAGFIGLPGETATSCAQTLAMFLSLNGFKLANVQAAPSGPTYTIVGPTRNH